MRFLVGQKDGPDLEVEAAYCWVDPNGTLCFGGWPPGEHPVPLVAAVAGGLWAKVTISTAAVGAAAPGGGLGE